MNENRKQLIKNIFSLSALQFLNLIIPLITLPYLINVVGNSGYGSYAICYSMIQLLIIICTYGFGFSATKQISQNRDNPSIISTIFVSTILSKLILFSIFTPVFLLVTYYLYSEEYMFIVLLGLGIVIGDILNPVWFFQGVEDMKYMTISNFICKLVSTLLIFIFIKTKSDYQYIILFNALGYLTSGFFSFRLSIYKYSIQLKRVHLCDIVRQLKEGWYIFLSTIFMNLYRNSNVLILGLFVNDAAVGVYASVERIIKAGQAIASPISNALFPNVSASFKKSSMVENKMKIYKITKLVGVFLIILCVVFILSAPIINTLLLGGQQNEAISMIRIMAWIIFFGGLNYILGIIGLINFNMQRIFLRYVIYTGVFGVLVLIVTVKYIGLFSACISMLLSEILLFFLCLSKIYTLK